MQYLNELQTFSQRRWKVIVLAVREAKVFCWMISKWELEGKGATGKVVEAEKEGERERDLVSDC